MLAHILAIAVGLGSFALYMAAFFYPEVYRRNDFIWSGVGLFYALVLWICAGRITGGVLLGQMAGVTLLMGLGWQLLQLRREKTPHEQQTEISPQIREKLVNWFAPVTQLFNSLKTPSSPAKAPNIEDAGEAVLETPVPQVIRTTEPTIETPVEAKPPSQSSETIPPEPIRVSANNPPVEIIPEPVTLSDATAEPISTSNPVIPKSSQPKKEIQETIPVEEIGDFWADETIDPDKSEVPEPAIVSNLEDLTNLHRPVDNLEEEMTQSFENMVSEADLTTSESSKKVE